MLSPLSWLLLALVFTWLGFQLRERGRWLVRLASGVAAVAIVAMTPLVANALVGWLETQAPLAATCISAPPPVAVVLAGDVDTGSNDPADVAALALSSRRRVDRAIAWWQERPGRSLIMSGGPPRAGALPAGLLMANYARRLGVDGAALRVEGVSTSTWESARALPMLQPRVQRRVVLITSAMHMPRARYSMERAGFDVCTIVADARHIPFGLPGYLVPQSGALRKTESALHELVGLAYYRWRGERSSATQD